ncbi:unnamed protein product [Boreogadus saida]
MGAETGLRRSWALLAFLGVAVASRWGAAAAAAAEVYTNTWAVRVIGGAGEADRIATKHGFVNHGNSLDIKKDTLIVLKHSRPKAVIVVIVTEKIPKEGMLPSMYLNSSNGLDI